jgi:molybdate-binding protein
MNQAADLAIEEVVESEDQSKGFASSWLTTEYNVKSIQRVLDSLGTDLDTLDYVQLAMDEYEVLISSSTLEAGAYDGIILRLISEKFSLTHAKMYKGHKQIEKLFNAILKNGRQVNFDIKPDDHL